jgi:hypothetical protein
MDNASLKVLVVLGAVCLCLTLVPTGAQAGHKDWSVTIGGYDGAVSFGSYGGSVYIPGAYAPYPPYPHYYAPGYHHPRVIHRHPRPGYGWVPYGPTYYY